MVVFIFLTALQAQEDELALPAVELREVATGFIAPIGLCLFAFRGLS